MSAFLGNDRRRIVAGNKRHFGGILKNDPIPMIQHNRRLRELQCQKALDVVAIDVGLDPAFRHSFFNIIATFRKPLGGMFGQGRNETGQQAIADLNRTRMPRRRARRQLGPIARKMKLVLARKGASPGRNDRWIPLWLKYLPEIREETGIVLEEWIDVPIPLVTHVFRSARRVLVRRLLVPAELAGPGVTPTLQVGLRNEVVFSHITEAPPVAEGCIGCRRSRRKRPDGA
jgi:hypothetical protein